MKKAYFIFVPISIVIIIVASVIVLNNQEPSQTWQSDIRRQLVSLLNQGSTICAQPAAEDQQQCQQIEQQILDSTVRIRLHGWVDRFEEEQGLVRIVGDTESHATVVDGRYLVTHNHFDLPFTKSSITGDKGLLSISVIALDGQPILNDIEVGGFNVVFDTAETVVLDFGLKAGQGIFTAEDVPSAPMVSGQTVKLKPGMEVAQVDWDGNQAHVDWVMVEYVRVENGTPRIELANYVEVGASGGGIYLNGVHIANNWTHNVAANSESGSVIRQYTTGALNPDLPVSQIAAAN